MNNKAKRITAICIGAVIVLIVFASVMCMIGAQNEKFCIEWNPTGEKLSELFKEEEIQIEVDVPSVKYSLTVGELKNETPDPEKCVYTLYTDDELVYREEEVNIGKRFLSDYEWDHLIVRNSSIEDGMIYSLCYTESASGESEEVLLINEPEEPYKFVAVGITRHGNYEHYLFDSYAKLIEPVL